MFRVITYVSGHRRNVQQEKGPWLSTREDAEYWVQTLNRLGYRAHVEDMDGKLLSEVARSSLGNALANMV